MNFKRKLIGCHRGQIDEMLVEREKAINLEKEQREQLIQALKQEGKTLEEQFNRLNQLLEEAEKRTYLLTSYAKNMEAFFSLTQLQVEEQANKIKENAESTAHKTKLSTDKIINDTKSLTIIMDDIQNSMLHQAAATQDILSAHAQDLEHLRTMYLPEDDAPNCPNESSSAAVENDLEKSCLPEQSYSFGNERAPLKIVKNGLVPSSETHVKEELHSKGLMLEALVIDDDPTILSVVRALLEREGMQVTEASDGREAMKLIDSLSPPSIIIMDMMLPYVDGLQLVTRIRSMENWGKTPIIMLTSKSSENEVVRLLEAGANDYMLKPFNTKELVARIKRLIDSSVKAL
ncbi:MAG TPA: response regulator [Syntrophomonadaceae bacterium]|nr:response regulator [Syntrophomonadaceae bacterium]